MPKRMVITRKETIVNLVIILLWLLCVFYVVIPYFSKTAHGQVLTTAETIGKGNQSVFLSENHLFVDEVDLNIAYAQYIRGLSDRLDFYFSVGDTVIFKKHQEWIGVGANYHLLRLGMIDFSLFNILSMPLNRRNKASAVLLNSAFIASRNFGKFSLYSGMNSLIPIGARDRGVFTPPDNEINVPLGIFIPWEKWGIFLEGDYGHVKAVGAGLAYSF